jgi:hypothetical protein
VIFVNIYAKGGLNLNECDRCKDWQNKRDDCRPIDLSLSKLITSTLGSRKTTALWLFLVISCLILSLAETEFTHREAARIAVVFALCHFLYINGAKIYRNNIVGRTIICFKDKEGCFHQHEGTDYQGERLLSYRVGGYFRPNGKIFTDGQGHYYWKKIFAWSGYDVMIEDRVGSRLPLTGVYESAPHLFYKVFEAVNLPVYLLTSDIEYTQKLIQETEERRYRIRAA